MTPIPKPKYFVPYERLGNRSNIIVDGAAQEATVLTLSHWPKSGTPDQLKRDTSAEIVFAYLEKPDIQIDVDVVSNNHFDVDGLIGLFTLIDPQLALQYRDLLIDTASAGDFGVYKYDDAARISMTLSGFADPSCSPLGKSIFELPYPDQVASLYEKLLPELAKILVNTENYKSYWEFEERHLLSTINLIDSGSVVIEERPELDLAIVHIPEKLVTVKSDESGIDMDSACHPYAINTSTLCNRILLICGQAFEFRYRYESWVQFISRRPLPRVSLKELVEQLNNLETSGGKWICDEVDQITPGMYLSGSMESSIPKIEYTTKVQDHLAKQPSAWDPYD